MYLIKAHPNKKSKNGAYVMATFIGLDGQTSPRSQAGAFRTIAEAKEFIATNEKLDHEKFRAYSIVSKLSNVVIDTMVTVN